MGAGIVRYVQCVFEADSVHTLSFPTSPLRNMVAPSRSSSGGRAGQLPDPSALWGHTKPPVLCRQWQGECHVVVVQEWREVGNKCSCCSDGWLAVTEWLGAG